MRKSFNIVSLILCILLIFVLLGNITIIVKGSLNPERPPSVLGITSMMVMSGSMSGEEDGHIEVGDLIFTKSINQDSINVGDVITFMENEKTVVTHRVIEKLDDGTYKTKGDANVSEDQNTVSYDNVIGKLWFRIPKLGNVAMFAQTPIGMVVFIGVPVLLYFIIDLIKGKKKPEKSKEDLEKELEELRAQLKEKE